MTHLHEVRVYWEDTDAGGVVYHASYLRFCERARTEWARGRGLDQGRLREEGVVLVVRRMACDWLGPARLDDLLAVASQVEGATGARLLMRQEVRRGEAVLFAASVTLAAMGLGGRPRRLPALLG